jgi:putative transposase
MSIAFTERLAEAGIHPSVGAVGSSYDNALAETINGLFKTELIKPRGPWRTVDQVELATAEMEAAYYAQQPAWQPAGLSHQ